MGTRRNWNEEQIIGILKQVEAGRTVAKVCGDGSPLGSSVGESTYYKWKSKYGELEVNEARRLKTPALTHHNLSVKIIVDPSV